MFVGGSVHSGKNILWRLLDGHSAIISNCLHSNIGYFLLNDKCKNLFLKKIPGIGVKTKSYLPSCDIIYNSGEIASVDIGTFFYGLYTFSGYKTFYSWAKGNSMFVNMKEGENDRFPFSFHIDGFEKSLEKKLFSEKKVFTEEQLLDVIYSSYIECLADKPINYNSIEQNFCFVDTLPNGIIPPKMVSEKVPGAKIILMKRNLESLLYANACRIISYQGDTQVDSSFKRTLYNQKEYQAKMNLFHKEATDLQASNKNVMLVDFNNLILNTDNTMKDLAKFIGIQYEPILALPSINGTILSNDKYQIIGKINDDPYECLSNTEIDLLKYFLFSFNKQYSVLKNASIFLQAIKWRHLHNLSRMIGALLKTVLPNDIYSYMKKIYRRI